MPNSSSITSALLPISYFQNGFTACPSLQANNLSYEPLDDKKLGVHKVSSRTSHRVVTPPPPETYDPSLPPPSVAWEALYPKGSISPSAAIPGGFGFYLSGPAAFTHSLHTGATEALFSYRMMLNPGWKWVKGGKLPGVFGGVGDLAYGCTGGRKDKRCKCFDLRPMWRADAVAELYAYLPLMDNNTKQLLASPPLSKQNADYGVSVGRGAFHLENAVGRWVSIAIRVKLNDVGMENGEIQLWLDGGSAISVAGLTLRHEENAEIKGMHFQTFFGGHTEDWASPEDQKAWFADVTGVIIQ